VRQGVTRHIGAMQWRTTSADVIGLAWCIRFQIVIRFVGRPALSARMTKPLIFTISAACDDEAAVWTGHCDDIPAAADAPTLDDLLEKISAMALDLLPDNHPGVDPASVYLQITALREAEPATV
jgi:hypothetical protein